jgi:hypothetical protein
VSKRAAQKIDKERFKLKKLNGGGGGGFLGKVFGEKKKKFLKFFKFFVFFSLFWL